jgi:two-component system chemotaxis response regulator CheY
MRAYVRVALESDGVDEVVEAATGVEALKHLSRGGFTLVLLDVNLPDLSGLELVAFARRLPSSRAVPVVMVTTEGRDADRDRAIALGASGYVVKPFTAASLLAALRPFRAAA